MNKNNVTQNTLCPELLGIASSNPFAIRGTPSRTLMYPQVAQRRKDEDKKNEQK